MGRRVRYHGDFRADLRAQLKWLVANRPVAWIDSLKTAIDEAVELLSRFPSVGTIEATEGDMAVRRLILRKVPYVVWFLSDTAHPAADVWMLRLFHARQDRPPARIPERLGTRRQR